MCSACGAEGARRAQRAAANTPHGKFGIVVAMDYVVRNAGMVGILHLQLLEDFGGLQLLGVGFVGRVSTSLSASA